MKSIERSNGLIIIIIGLVGLISAFLFNNSVDNDFLCISMMILFLAVELYGLTQIVKDKKGLR